MRVKSTRHFFKTGHFALFLFVCLLSACESKPEVIQLEGSTMGTTYHITIPPPNDQINPLDLEQDVSNLLIALNRTFSTYDTESELSRFNRSEPGKWVEVSPELLAVLQQAQTISELSEGAFDVTVGPLVDTWGFGAVDFDGLPSEEELAEAASLLGYQKLQIKADTGSINKTVALEIDLSAIAKGYAVDQVADHLDNLGLGNYLVEIGGEIRTKGNSPRNTPWRLGIEVPELMHQHEVHRALKLNKAAVATSGDYRNFIELHGQHYSHTIDPRTRYPVTHELASVTVIMNSASEADGWATAFSVLGPKKGLELAAREGIAAYFIARVGDKGYSVEYTATFKPYLDDAGN